MIVNIALRAVILLLAVPTAIAVPIIGGELTEANELPSTVAIARKDDSEKDVCGGTIISPDTIVTAAHCSQRKETEYQVRVGSLVSFYI
jgi:secreted trypsin-like serine protease